MKAPMNLGYMQKLFSYDGWANRESAAALRKLQVPPARSVGLLAHIVSAERLWLERLRQQKQTNPVWPEFDLKHCEEEIKTVDNLWTEYLGSIGEADLSRSVAYKNTKGENFSSQTQDILMHVILHSAYHRGQIAADIRAAGFTPAYTDFIHAIRQGAVE
ncbi:MAG: DUF664 domain-containing protein [Acidobacteriaceae bacterium]|nr:DUF664 domain-containing protein [Acidobacteriaceae bacterium]